VPIPKQRSSIKRRVRKGRRGKQLQFTPIQNHKEGFDYGYNTGVNGKNRQRNVSSYRG
jgi:hypothetical protein